MKKITEKEAVGGLLLVAVAIAAVSTLGGSGQKTVTYGYGGGGGMETGAGTEYGYDLEQSFTDWLNSLPQPDTTPTPTSDPSILDVPTIAPFPVTAPTAAPTASGGDFYESTVSFLDALVMPNKEKGEKSIGELLGLSFGEKANGKTGYYWTTGKNAPQPIGNGGGLRNTTPTNSPSYTNVNGGGSGGSGGTGKAVVVDLRTDANAYTKMAQANVVTIHTNQNGKSTGTVTLR